MKKIILVSLSIVIVLLFFLLTRINKEDLSFTSRNEMINGKSLKKEIQKSDKAYVIFVSSSCPGAVDFMPNLKKNCQILKDNKVSYYIVFDELYNKDLDHNLENFINKYKFKEFFYIMDINSYPDNGGLFSNKKRYKNFVDDLLGLNNQAPLGYPLYVKFTDGNFIEFNNTISKD